MFEKKVYKKRFITVLANTERNDRTSGKAVVTLVGTKNENENFMKTTATSTAYGSAHRTKN